MSKTEMKKKLAIVRSKALAMLNNPFKAALDAPAVVTDVVDLLGALIESLPEEESSDG